MTQSAPFVPPLELARIAPSASSSSSSTRASAGTGGVADCGAVASGSLKLSPQQVNVSQKLMFDSPVESSRMSASVTAAATAAAPSGHAVAPCSSSSIGGRAPGCASASATAPIVSSLSRASSYAGAAASSSSRAAASCTATGVAGYSNGLPASSRSSAAVMLHGSFGGIAATSSRARASSSSAALTALRASCSLSAQALSHVTSAYSQDVAKVLREAARCSEAAVVLRVLPKQHLLQQLVLQEQCQRELAVAQEAAARVRLHSKMVDERARMHEQQLARAHKAAAEALKAQQQSELVAQRDSVAAQQRDVDAVVRERLRALASLQPRMAVVQAALTDAKRELVACDAEGDAASNTAGGYAVLGQLLEEERRWSRAMRASVRYGKTRSAEADGGALPYWYKECVAASYNVAAICSGAPYRAVVRECAAALPCKTASERKIVVVVPASTAKDENAMTSTTAVLAYAHARCAPPPPPPPTQNVSGNGTVTAAAGALVAAAEACAPLLQPQPQPRDEGAALLSSAMDTAECLGVLWPKDVLAELTRKARGASGAGDNAAALSLVLRNSSSALSYGGVSSSAELTTNDVQTHGNSASSSSL